MDPVNVLMGICTACKWAEATYTLRAVPSSVTESMHMVRKEEGCDSFR